MAGKITVSTINNDTGVLATQNGMTGIAKAWVNYNGSSQTITASFNVSSVTRNSTGNYTVNFSTSMPNADYSVAGFCKNNGSVDMTIGATPAMTKTSSAFQFYCVSFGGTQTESATACVTVFSS
jgi:hypothetical protein